MQCAVPSATVVLSHCACVFSVRRLLNCQSVCLFFYIYFVDRASLYNLFQMKPTGCTLLLSIFISTSLHVSGNCVPIIRRTYCIYATLVLFHSVWVAVWPAEQAATHCAYRISSFLIQH